MKNICVIGTGQMGPGIAQTCALAGYNTTIIGRTDEALQRARATVEANLAAMLPYKLVTPDEITSMWARLRFDIWMENIAPSDLIIEAVTENLELKQRMFSELESFVRDDAIFASNTSGMRATELSKTMRHPERMLVTHYFNPAHLLPLVEVVPGEHTSATTSEAVLTFLKSTGHVPVLCKKEVLGFIANRLQHAMWREALALVENGVASPDEIDQALKNSFGARTPVLGIFEHLDLVGADMVLALHTYLLADLDAQRAPNKLLRDKVAAGETGAKVGKGFYDWGPGGKVAADVLRARDTQLLELAQKRRAAGQVTSER